MTTVLFAKTLERSLDDLSVSERGHFLDFWLKLQRDPAQPSLSLERLQRAADPNLWSGRVTQDIRAILHRDGDTATIVYAGRHDNAYAWAERRRVTRHEVTGALQIVESTEVIEERIAADPTPVEAPGLFDAFSDGYLLSLGVPREWLEALRAMKSDEVFWQAMGSLPEEAYERLFQLLAGEAVQPPEPIAATRPAIESPDTRRRFAELDEEGLRRLLAAPLASWVTFLHPSQERLVGASFSGPVKVTGSAGTGKTVVAMHRARALALAGERVPVTTYVSTLCDNIQRNLRLLCGREELARITVATVHSQARLLLERAGERVRAPRDGEMRDLLDRHRVRTACPFPLTALQAEWDKVLETQGITSWEQYRDASRAGRGRPLTAVDRRRMWAVFGRVIEECRARRVLDWSSQCRAARELLESGGAPSPYDAVIVDEVQDLGPQELRLLAALAGTGADRLFLTGDAGQRLYRGPFSMRSLGIDVRGRSQILRINYRTTEQIRRFADRISGNKSDDLDGGVEGRTGTVSLLHGPPPRTQGCRNRQQQYEHIALEIMRCREHGLALNEIAVFAPTNARADAVRLALARAGLPVRRLAQGEDGSAADAVSVTTMHRAKGLEFKVVFVADVTEDALPSQGALQGLDDPRDIEDALARERQLLYVSLTRARDELHICWSGRPSRFLDGAVGRAAGQ